MKTTRDVSQYTISRARKWYLNNRGVSSEHCEKIIYKNR